MKQIVAFVQPHMLSRVVLALSQVEALTGLSISKVQGFGRGRGKNQPKRIVEDQIEYVPHSRLEIFCADELVEKVMEEIRANAHTGLKGDGKIFVVDIADALRVSTGERGEAAL